MSLLDNILDSLGNLGSKGDSIRSKALELKTALNNILKIASDQSKSMTDEYLQRQNRLEEILLQTVDKKSQIEKELVSFAKKKTQLEESLDRYKKKKSEVNELIRRSEELKSVSSVKLKSLELWLLQVLAT